MKRRLFAIAMTLAMALSLLPTAALAEEADPATGTLSSVTETDEPGQPDPGTETENDETDTPETSDVSGASLETNIEETDFVVGQAIEFSFTTKGSYGDPQKDFVIGTSNFDNTNKAIEKLEYYETDANKGQGWKDLEGNSFGPSTGFPYVADATSKFRVTFAEAGEYEFTAYILKAGTELDGTYEDSAIVCQATVNFTVEEAPVEDPVAEVDGEPYDSLADAVNAVQGGGTIVLLRGIDNSEIVTINKPNVTFTIDFQNQELNSASNSWAIQVQAGTVTLKNGTVQGAYGGISCSAGANVTLQDMKVSKTKTTGQKGDLSAIENSGTMVIESGTYDTAEGTFAPTILNLAEMTIEGGTFKTGATDGG